MSLPYKIDLLNDRINARIQAIQNANAPKSTIPFQPPTKTITSISPRVSASFKENIKTNWKHLLLFGILCAIGTTIYSTVTNRKRNYYFRKQRTYDDTDVDYVYVTNNEDNEDEDEYKED